MDGNQQHDERAGLADYEKYEGIINAAPFGLLAFPSHGSSGGGCTRDGTVLISNPWLCSSCCCASAK